MRTKQTIQNLGSFDIDELFSDYTPYHNKKFKLDLIKQGLTLVFNKEVTPHNKF